MTIKITYKDKSEVIITNVIDYDLMDPFYAKFKTQEKIIHINESEIRNIIIPIENIKGEQDGESASIEK